MDLRVVQEEGGDRESGILAGGGAGGDVQVTKLEKKFVKKKVVKHP